MYCKEKSKKRSTCSSFESHQDDVLEITRDMPEIASIVTQPVIPVLSRIPYSYSNLSDILILSSPNPVSNYNETFDYPFSNPILVPPLNTFSNPNRGPSPNLSNNLISSSSYPISNYNQVIDSSFSDSVSISSPNTFSNPNIPSSFNPVLNHNPTFDNSFVDPFSTSSRNTLSSLNFSSSYESTSNFLPDPKQSRFS